MRGVTMGVYRTFGDLGVVAAPPLLGALADATSLQTALGADAVIVAATAVTFGPVAREDRPIDAPTPELADAA